MYIYRLAHALGDEGHHVDVVHDIDAYHLQHPAEPDVHFPEHSQVIRHGLTSGHNLLSPLLTHQTGRAYLKRKKIEALLAGRAYDVIQYHNISLLGPEVMRLAPASGQPMGWHTLTLVVHLHMSCGINGVHGTTSIPTLRSDAKRPPSFGVTSYLKEMPGLSIVVAPVDFRPMHAEEDFYPWTFTIFWNSDEEETR
jgi:hypothetical protein